MESFPLQKNGKSQRPLAELLHEQQEPFMLKEFLTERQYLCKRVEGADGAMKKSCRDLATPYGMVVQCSRFAAAAAAANSEPLGSANGEALSLRLPLADSAFTGARSHGRRPQCKVSSPLRSPVAKASCIKSPSAGAARLLEAAVRILEPGLHTCSRPRSSFSFPPAATHMPTTVRYLLEMDRRAANCSSRSLKHLRKKNPMKPQLDLPPLRSDESNFNVKSRSRRNPRRKSLRRSHFDRDCAEGSSGESDTHGDFIIQRKNMSSAGRNSRVNSSRALPQETTLNAWQRASEALISAFRLSPVKDPGGSMQEKEGSVIRYSRIFSFGNKVKKADKVEVNAEACLSQKRARYGLLKSILRRLSPTKESSNEAPSKIRCHSERIESGVQGANVTGSISKRFSDAMRSFSSRACRQELQGNDEVRLRVRDIVRWGSFDESEDRDNGVGQSGSGLTAERCISLECPTENFAEVAPEACLSTEAEMGHIKMKVASKRNEENWQGFLKRRKNASSDFSTTSSSSAWFESCLDSDSGSTSLDVLSSNGSSEGNGSSDSRELKGIDLCVLEVLSPCGYFSLEVDENGGVKDFHHSPRCDVSQPLMETQLCDTVCDQIEDIAASDAMLEPDYLQCCPSSLPRGLGTLQISDDKGSPVNFVAQASTNISPRCGETEEETVEHIPCIGDNISDTSRQGCGQSDGCEEASDAGCFEEVEQLSPVSVLDSPFEEESSGFEETLANIQRAKQQLLQKICEYERLAHMDPTLLENRMASWKEEPSEDEAYSSCTDDETRRMSTVVEPAKMDWEEGETEEYVREVLNCSQTVSEDLTSLTVPWGGSDHCSYVAEDLNDIQMQVCAGGCYVSSHSPSQGLKAKQLSEQARRLLFDRVNEELQSAGKCSGNGFMAEVWLREQVDPERLAKKICGQILAWKEVGTSHTDKLVELDLNRKGGEWRSFKEEAEEIGAKIELAIFGVLVEEVLVDLLAHFHTCEDSQII